MNKWFIFISKVYKNEILKTLFELLYNTARAIPRESVRNETFIFETILFPFRYSAVRKQFGPRENVEIPVLEYQMQVFSFYFVSFL